MPFFCCNRLANGLDRRGPVYPQTPADDGEATMSPKTFVKDYMVAKYCTLRDNLTVEEASHLLPGKHLASWSIKATCRSLWVFKGVTEVLDRRFLLNTFVPCLFFWRLGLAVWLMANDCLAVALKACGD